MVVYFYDDLRPGGFTNQIAFLIDYLACLSRKRHDTKPVVILNCFFNDHLNHRLTTPISKILDLVALTSIFPQFVFIDVHNLPNDFELHWGCRSTYTQLGSKHLFEFVKYKNPTLLLSLKDIAPNGERHHLRIHCPSKEIPRIDLPYRDFIVQVDRTQYFRDGVRVLFDEGYEPVFRTLQFSYRIHGTDEESMDLLSTYRTHHIVHLRTEEDAIEAWATPSETSEPGYENDRTMMTYRRNIEDAYIATIKASIDPTHDESILHILTADRTDSRVLRWMESNGYRVFMRPYNPDIGRECNALEDLIISTTYGNGVLIGHSRSTFSHLLKIRVASTAIFFV